MRRTPERSVITVRVINMGGRSRLPSGLRGRVVGLHPSGWLAVCFDNGRRVLIEPDAVRYLESSTGSERASSPSSG